MSEKGFLPLFQLERSATHFKLSSNNPGNRKFDLILSDINGKMVEKFMNVEDGFQFGVTLLAGTYFATLEEDSNILGRFKLLKTN